MCKNKIKKKNLAKSARLLLGQKKKCTMNAVKATVDVMSLTFNILLQKVDKFYLHTRLCS